MSSPKEALRAERRGSNLREIHEEERRMLGDEFRLARQRRGEDLAAVAAKLRIRADHLQAIEDGRFEDLPGKTYAIGFLRTYSRHLGLDPEAVLSRYRQETRSDSSATLYFPEPIKEARRPRSWLIALALLLLGGVYAAWYYGSTDRRAAQQVSPLPEQFSTATAPEYGPEPPEAGTTPSTIASGTSESMPFSSGAARTDQLPQTAQTSPGASVSPNFQSPAPKGQIGPDSGQAPGTMAQGTGPASSFGQGSGTSESAAPGISGGQGAPVYLQGHGDTAVAATEPGDWRTPPPDAPGSSVPVAPQAQSQPEQPGLADKEHASGDWQDPTGVTRQPDVRRPDFGNLIAAARTPQTGEPATPGDRQAALSEPDAYSSQMNSPPYQVNSSDKANPNGANPTQANADARQDSAAIRPVTTLHATGATWIELKAQDGEVLLSRILQPGESYTLPDETGLVLTTGNAGGLDIEVSGNHTGPMGPVGAVRRHISIDQLRADAR